jgi:hypothetical protein
MPTAAVSFVGAELVSLLHLFVLMMVGFAVTKTWIWSRSRLPKVLPKKVLEDNDEVEESDLTSTPKKKGAYDRKKSRKPKVAAVKSWRALLEAADEPAPCKVQGGLARSQAEPPQEVHEPPSPCPDAAQEVALATEQEGPDESPGIEEESPAVSERVAKMLAKKQERKAKKAEERRVSEEQSREEEQSHSVGGGEAESDIVAFVKAMPDAEDSSDDMAQETLTPSMVPVTEEHAADEAELSAEVSKDHLETDARSESDDVCVHQSTPEGISTPEMCLSPRGPEAEPSTWCMPQVPQIEGWVAVAVPAEFAPPGAPGPFDGLWTNRAEERIVIDHDEILFEGGMQWVANMMSVTSFSVFLGEEEFTAELDMASHTLSWSDGDVWSCVGQTDCQQRWAAAREAEGMPPVLFEGEQYFQMAPMPAQPAMVLEAPVDLPKNQLIPQDAKSWEVCWDWAKKGWCKRGSACEWYHPPQNPQSYLNCQPCEMAQPFADMM